MAKPEWGFKRLCQGCGARFYDLKRDPIVCPHCGTVFDPDLVPKYGRRTGGAKAAQAEAKNRVPIALVDDEIEVKEAVEDAEDEAVLEDASDLGEDDDDMAEVMEHIDEGEVDVI